MKPAEALVAVGTRRGPKLRAVERVLFDLRGRFPGFLPGELAIEPRSVPSGVPETPRTTSEAMDGARRRALGALGLLRGEGREPLLALGLEGGVVVERVTDGGAFLESWAYATDGRRGRFGSSGAISLPAELEAAVLERGESLGSAADLFFQRREIAANEGTFGALTLMMVSREEAFARSLLHALAPFYNELAYSSRRESGGRVRS
jgi:non-canonical (house-cleaning) NTP pyrophosphatase